MGEVRKGARVRIVAGKATGRSGVVFWEGPDRFGPGTRYGVKGDDGEATWVGGDQLEVQAVADAPAPPVEAQRPAHAKGDRVRVVAGDAAGAVGEVFWIGESKFRPGMPRYGVKDADGVTHWVDQVEVERVE